MNDASNSGFSHRYYLTSGIKFGGDWLAYPGDPLMYHAQFVVRVEIAERAMRPTFFVAAAREAHSARKHLLYAFSEQVIVVMTSIDGHSLLKGKDGEIKTHYVSLMPRDGFGRADRRKRRRCIV